MKYRLTIRIDTDLEQLLERYCQRTGESKSTFVRRAIRNHLEKESFRDLRRQLIPYAKSIGWITDQNVFDNIS